MKTIDFTNITKNNKKIRIIAVNSMAKFLIINPTVDLLHSYNEKPAVCEYSIINKKTMEERWYNNGVMTKELRYYRT